MYSYKIEQAIKAAAILHQDQVRRGPHPYPYITHLFSVAAILSNYTEDEDVIVAGLLHDTIEDTDYTFKELETDFGARVRDLVLHVTEEKVSQDTNEKSSWKKRKDAYVAQLKSAPEDALLIAAADKIHNMRSAIDEWEGYYQGFIRAFGGSLDERLLMYQSISNVLNRRLENAIIHEFNHVFKEYQHFIKEVKKEIGAR